jgi:hypothetical protein
MILTHNYKGGGRFRAFNTVAPLAETLGLKIYSKIRRDDATGVAAAVKRLKGDGNILICWEHTQMANITAAIGVTQYANESGWKGDIEYPHKRFDLIWVIPSPYSEIVSIEGEHIPILDDGKTPDQENSATLFRKFSMSLFMLVSAHILYALLLSLGRSW